ncbi:alpha-amylase family glycosyl hydrolase [Silvibacterium dinghuense]|uniref:DUF3459 domain-containing protein n=1 Tax=Silvibacterium dinghuense TaxID=1560006 RepID=A0A4Q1SGZ2_9BACT|nr:alpha-amylase family glycosyl hydrolase [Silvibacterium dinghuense]RXS96821.1 DUF3459 domain-containing protein [Silvibacterium dinghuense]
MAVLSALLSCAMAFAQSGAPVMSKIDPPNWWTDMPAPMLLVKGENLEGARFTFSVKNLKIAKTTISENGHWAELWLAADPDKPKQMTITAETAKGRATLPFVFEPRRAVSEGFAGFSSRDVMYLIMTDRFADGNEENDGPGAQSSATSAEAQAEREKPRGWHGGDLRGVIDHLDYLQALGITTVWVTPVYQNHEPDSYHGYGATDMYAVDEHYGTLEDYRALADALHKRGMKFVLDTVPNHVGPAIDWVSDPPEPDWFHGTKAEHRVAQGDFAPLVDPHAPWRDRRDVTEGWFANTLPDLNQENPAVEKYLIQNAIWWTEEAGLDGLRLDTFPYVGRPFWQAFHAQLHALYPNLTTVGEVFNGDPTITSAFAGGVTRAGVDTGLYTPFDFPMHFALVKVFAQGAPMTAIADVLRKDALYPHPERLVPFLGNHDTARFLTEAHGDHAAERLGMAVLLTTRGMPQIYSGDEIAMSGGDDPDNRHDFPGGFPGMKQDAFNESNRNAEQQSMYAWTNQLLALRAKSAALNQGEEQVLYVSDDALIYLRTSGEERVLVAVHRGAEDVTLHVKTEMTDAEGRSSAEILFGEGTATAEAEGLAVHLPANSVLVASLTH